MESKSAAGNNGENINRPSGLFVSAGVSLALFLLIALLYFRVQGHEFIELDDNQYVANNAQQAGTDPGGAFLPS